MVSIQNHAFNYQNSNILCKSHLLADGCSPVIVAMCCEIIVKCTWKARITHEGKYINPSESGLLGQPSECENGLQHK